MNDPRPDPRLLSELRSSLDAVSAQVDGMRSRLGELERQLGIPPRDREPVRAPQGPMPPARPNPVPSGPRLFAPAGPGAGRPGPGHPAPGAHGVPGPPRVWTPAVPARDPRAAISASTVLAAVGGAIMLLGIGFFLVLSAQAGYFGPVARVVVAAVFALSLFVGGIFLARRAAPTRSPGSPTNQGGDSPDTRARSANPGGLALVATGCAAGILDVLACTSLYHWFPPLLGLILTGGIAVSGMVLARMWRSPLLATLLCLGVMLLTPVVTLSVLWPCFLVIMAVVTAVLCSDLGDLVRLVRTVVPALGLAAYPASHTDPSTGEQWVYGSTVMLFALVLTVNAVVEWWFRGVRTPGVPLSVVAVAVPVVWVPAIPVLEGPVPVHLLIGVAYLVASAVVARPRDPGVRPPSAGVHPVPVGNGRVAATPGPDPRAGRPAGDPPGGALSATLGAVGFVFVVIELFQVDGADARALGFLLSAMAHVAAAAVFRRRWLDVVGALASLLALMSAASAVRPWSALIETRAIRDLDLAGAGLSLAVTVLCGAVIWWSSRRLEPGTHRMLIVVGSVLALAAASVAVVATGVEIGRAANDAPAGFLGAHLAVTVLWIAIAGWLVLTRTTRIPESHRLGFVLVALALVKLFVLDLATLPGILRVIAFLVVGGVLLAVAARYRGESDDRPTQGGDPRVRPGGPYDPAAPGFRAGPGGQFAPPPPGTDPWRGPNAPVGHPDPSSGWSGGPTQGPDPH